MASIHLDHVAHRYVEQSPGTDDFALQRVDHIWDDGMAYALLGPSGCGKTTLLNIISGLLQPSEGRVLFDGIDITDTPTEQRHIAQIFQFPVIYDTMTVFDNLAFPLRNRGRSEAAVQRRVAEVADVLKLTSVLANKARNLSADLKQTISLGRGLVREDVAAILFDEPLTMIDPQQKWGLRAELKRLHRQLSHTMIYVTHDQAEALSFADRVAVMCDGEIVQLGTPQELFERPAHTFVGYFIGSPGMNVFPATVDGGVALVDGCALELARSYALEQHGNVEIGVRPEFMRLGRDVDSSGNGLPVTLKRIEDIGKFKIARVDFRGRDLSVVVPEGIPISDEANRITFDPQHVNVYADGWIVDGQAAR